MVRPMLWVHWKQIRLALVPLMVASFGMPLLAVDGLGTPPGAAAPSLEAYRIVSAYEVWLPYFPTLAFAIGMALALSSWNWDHQLNHVYALSLPVTRAEYTMLKLTAGGLLALLPAASMWLGGHLAVASITLPEGLNAYPDELAFRFLLAILLSYALLFAMAAGTVKTTAWVLTVFVSIVLIGSVGSDLLEPFVAPIARTNLLEVIAEWATSRGGPFEVFLGSWALIDV